MSTTETSCTSAVQDYYTYLLDYITKQVEELQNASPLKLAVIGSVLSFFLLTLYYSRKLSTSTMIFRSVLSCFVWKNKLIGMKISTGNDDNSLLHIGSYIR